MLFLIKDNFFNGYNLDYLYIISYICIILSILVIITKNPIYCILYLIGLFIFISIYLILINLTYIGIAYLLVYIGAISMLFLFILMLIDIRISELHIQNNNSILLVLLISVIFYKVNNYVNIFDNENYILTSNTWDGYILENYDIVNIGNLIYSNLFILLIISSLILLLSMIGAIIINIENR